MCTKSLSCPLCCQSNFPNIDALRISLLKVTSRPLKCPICAEQLLGLDKLTIHLFGHSILGQEEERIPEVVEEKKKPTITASLKNVRKPKKEATTSAGGTNNGNHREKQTVNKVKCDICADEFSDHNFLKMHKSVFHEFPATPSGSPAAKQETVTKIDEPKDLFQCSMCPKAFRMKGSLKIHMRVVHLGCQKKYSQSSTDCATSQLPVTTSTTTTSVYQYQDVMQFDVQSNRQLMSAQNQSQPPPLTPTVSLSAPMGQPQIIKILDPRQLAEFIYVANQQQHQIVEHATPNGSPPSAASPVGHFSDVPSPSLPSPQSMGTIPETNKQWECDVCLKSFTTKYFLKKHKRLHTGEMPYSCQICGKSFTFQQSYHKHLLYHSDEKPHICTVCGRAFKELSTLHNHERIHSGEKPFSCETCGKCFRQRVSYLVHRRIHTNTQPYKCTACDKSFRYKVSQRTHKCPAQPPGTVVRQTGDLLQKLLQSSAILPTLQDVSSPMTDSDPPASIESTTDQSEPQEIKPEDYINRTLDELFNESYDKMGIGHHSGSYEIGQNQPRNMLFEPSSQPDNQDHHSATGSSSSTGENGIVPRIENLCLLSPNPQDVITFDGETMGVIDSIKLDLLYN